MNQIVSSNRNQAAPAPVFDMRARSRRLRAIAADPVLGEPGSTAISRAAIVMIAILTVGFVVWAAAAEIEETASTSGEIVAGDDVRVVQHLEGGILAELFVKEGETVEAGAPIARFVSTAASADLDQMQTRRTALIARTQRLLAFVGEDDPDFAELGPQAGALIAEQRTILAAQRDALQAKVAVVDRQIAERQSDLESLRGQSANLRDEVALHGEALEMRRELFERGLNSRLAVINVERDMSRANGELRRTAGRINVVENTIAALRQRREEVRKSSFEAAYTEFESASNELAEVEDILAMSRDRVDRLIVTAPVTGVVQQLPQRTEQAVIAPGGVVAEIVPVGRELIAETRISTRDIGYVAPGQPVQVKIQAFDFSLFGTVPGELVHVSPSTFVSEKGEAYYLGRVLLGRGEIKRDGTDYRLLPGMTVQADISTGSKTILQYLLKPIYTVGSQAFRER